ncbi:uncharacterized protein [Lolium perenne]|uniref:uncharacterized protein n=1 Tax=Lolium perenne TaxID=4522 RepID=UPI003A994610
MSEKSYKKRISRSVSTITKRMTMTNKDDFATDCMFDEGDGPGKKALGLWWAASGEDGVDRQAARQRRRSAPCWNCRVSWPWLLSLVCCLVAFLINALAFMFDGINF